MRGFLLQYIDSGLGSDGSTVAKLSRATENIGLRSVSTYPESATIVQMITVLGASGFIGSHLVKKLRETGVEYFAPGREELPKTQLGNIIYCIGLTADFRTKPFETVNAHVCHLAEVLQSYEFDSLLYLSSTRVYATNLQVAREQDSLQVAPLNPSDLYNISKAMGESIALNCGRRTRVARISNVYGGDFASDNFLSAIIREAMTSKKVVLQTSSNSVKDYLSVEDVVDGLIDIAIRGRERIYNLASGVNVSNGELAESLHSLTGCTVEFSPEAPTVSFPRISIERMQNEFNFRPSQVLGAMPHLTELYRDNEGISA
jgi:nucleoside-diphosphate-sugar epimerase